MKFENFIEMVKSRKGENVCIAIAELNELIDDSKVRISDEGYIELKHKEIKAQISLDNECGICIAQIKEVAEYDKYTHIKKSDIFVSPK